MKHLRCLALALLSSAVAHSQTVLFNNVFIPSDITHGGLYIAGSNSLAPGRRDAAEQFNSTVFTPAFLTSVTVSLRAFGPAGLMNGTVTLFSDASNSPGSVLETTTFSASLVTNAPTVVTANFAGTSLITFGPRYWIGFSMAPGSSFWAQWNAAQPALNFLDATSLDGTNWSVSNVVPGALTVRGVLAPGAVPEPATYGWFGAVAAFGLAAWRRCRRVTAKQTPPA